MTEEQKNELIERAKVAFDNDEQVVKWITALLSGEYTQCFDALASSQGFCCVGVAGRVVFGKRLRDIFTSLQEVGENMARVHVKDTYDKTKELLSKYGLTTEDYICMNDEFGYNFESIARAIVEDREDILLCSRKTA